MTLSRANLYRLPWSKTDNAGGWVEVTDECNLSCPGCYRHNLEGHRPLEEVKRDIKAVRRLTNCDRMAIAGGEPLIYPHILEVVDFISQNKMKPVLLTNGEKLTWDLALELKKAGLAKYHFHVDSGMRRKDWVGKNEAELNELRQRFADLVWDVGGVQCGYNITIFRSSIKYLPDIVDWCRRNVHKVQHVSLVAFRAIPLTDAVTYVVNDNEVDAGKFQHASPSLDEINITTDEMFQVLDDRFSDFRPCTYLGGTAAPESYKFLITVNVGVNGRTYGVFGAKAMELVQIFHHIFTGRYCSFVRNPKAGKKLFILSLFDGQLRKAFFNYVRAVARNPVKVLEGIYVQSISLQQPNEYFNGAANLCDGCVNMMVYNGELINSCRLDEYRMFGGPIIPVQRETTRIGRTNVLKVTPRA